MLPKAQRLGKVCPVWSDRRTALFLDLALDLAAGSGPVSLTLGGIAEILPHPAP